MTHSGPSVVKRMVANPMLAIAVTALSPLVAYASATFSAWGMQVISPYFNVGPAVTET
jgi:hypothetical protein